MANPMLGLLEDAAIAHPYALAGMGGGLAGMLGYGLEQIAKPLNYPRQALFQMLGAQHGEGRELVRNIGDYFRGPSPRVKSGYLNTTDEYGDTFPRSAPEDGPRLDAPEGWGGGSPDDYSTLESILGGALDIGADPMNLAFGGAGTVASGIRSLAALGRNKRLISAVGGVTNPERAAAALGRALEAKVTGMSPVLIEEGAQGLRGQLPGLSTTTRQFGPDAARFEEIGKAIDNVPKLGPGPEFYAAPATEFNLPPRRSTFADMSAPVGRKPLSEMEVDPLPFISQRLRDMLEAKNLNKALGVPGEMVHVPTHDLGQLYGNWLEALGPEAFEGGGLSTFRAPAPTPTPPNMIDRLARILPKAELPSTVTSPAPGLAVPSPWLGANGAETMMVPHSNPLVRVLSEQFGDELSANPKLLPALLEGLSKEGPGGKRVLRSGMGDFISELGGASNPARSAYEASVRQHQPYGSLPDMLYKEVLRRHHAYAFPGMPGLPAGNDAKTIYGHSHTAGQTFG